LPTNKNTLAFHSKASAEQNLKKYFKNGRAKAETGFAGMETSKNIIKLT
jgi:hypothetical protein